MFCPNCGNQIPENSFFCPFCGANLQNENGFVPPVNLEDQSHVSFASVLRKALSSTKFLVMCILVTVAAVLSCVPTTMVDEMGFSASANFDLFAILSTIAMWITYANAKSSDTVMNVGGLKFNAVIANIVFVINWVAAGIITVCGILFCAMGPMFSALFADEAMMEDFYLQITPVFEEYGLSELLTMFTGDFISMFMIGMGIAFVIIGIVMILLNVFYYGKVKKFANNLHISYITNRVTDLRFVTISNWFMVMGIFSIIGSLSSFAVNPAVAIASISGSASLIVASTWVKALSEEVAYILQPIEMM